MEVVNKNWFKTWILSFLCVVCLFACKAKTLEDLKHNQEVTIKGVLTHVGNVPFQEPAIRVKQFDYTLPLILKHNSMEKEIQTRMGKKVELSGVIRIKTLNDSPEARKQARYSLVVHRIKL